MTSGVPSSAPTTGTPGSVSSETGPETASSPDPTDATGGGTATAPRRRRPAVADAVCAAAVDVALAAAREAAGGDVGEHRGAYADGDRVVTHLFVARQPGYAGWHWSVTVARAPRSKLVTVSEIALLPGEGALRPPEWLPWSERLRPGDLGVGDLLPTAPDDDRLVPGYLLSDDPAVAEVEVELGLGRPRVMGRDGREETAERWYGSDAGPDAPLAKAAHAACGTCGFYLPLAGSLRALFGACGNLFAPDDGRVVSADHGCGAHSQVMAEPVPAGALPPVVMDDAELELVAASPDAAEPDAEAAQPDAVDAEAAERDGVDADAPELEGVDADGAEPGAAAEAGAEPGAGAAPDPE